MFQKSETKLETRRCENAERIYYVSQLLAPVGQNAELIPIYKFKCENEGHFGTTWVKNAYDESIKYKYFNNHSGHPYRIQHPDGSIEQKQYSLDGLLVKEIAKNGLMTLYSHDALEAYSYR